MKLVDLTRLLDPNDAQRIHPSVRAARVLVPKIHYASPAGEGVDIVCQAYGCTKDDLPDGEGWGTETIELASHTGTHVDAPLHYGTTCEGKPARTVTDIDVNELFCDAIVLDLRGTAGPGEAITVEALKVALKKNGAAVTTGSAILLRTGQEAYNLSQAEFFRYPGMTRESTLFLAGLGAKILGTDALGWDRPITMMKEVFQKSRDRRDIWDGHYAGREREVFIIQQLVNLAALPPSGFKVAFFPIKLKDCSAAPARVVAFLPGMAA
jgi:kynurenine formamidase